MTELNKAQLLQFGIEQLMSINMDELKNSFKKNPEVIPMYKALILPLVNQIEDRFSSIEEQLKELFPDDWEEKANQIKEKFTALKILE